MGVFLALLVTLMVQAAVTQSPKYAGVLSDCMPADFGPVAKTASPQAQQIISKTTGPPADFDYSFQGMIAERNRINSNKGLSDKYRAAYVGSTDEVIDLGGVQAVHISPKAGVTIAGKPGKTAAARDTKNAMYYLHGGAYIAGDPRVQYQSHAPLAVATGMDVYAPDYRLAPEHPYPAALDDAVAGYKALLTKFPADRIVLAGGSAGGHLSSTLLLRLAADQIPLPAAVVLFSPWTLMDMQDTETKYTLRCADPFLNFNFINASAHWYKGKQPNFDNQYLSPGKVDWGPATQAAKAAGSKMPPVLIFVGSREIFAGDAAALADVMTRGGMSATLRLYPGMWHTWSVGAPGPMALPEAEQATREAAEFIAKHMRKD